ncbi:MAG: endolytic transglycosylase MltG [Chlorobi bacterium]|nr:endolytic transglycosylase MltG [Chlorobiota bacterium]
MSASKFVPRALGIAVITTAAALGLLLQSPLTVEKREVLFVAEGTAMRDVLDTLEKRSAIRTPWFWRLLARAEAHLFGIGPKMGSYELTPTTSHLELFANILRGWNRQVRRLTIYEGETIFHLAGAIARTLDDDSVRVLRLLIEDSLARRFNIAQARSLEGFLLPATYYFFECEPVEHALRRIVRNFDNVWNSRFATIAAARGLSRNDVLTLASIVEGEVVNPSEYRRIAGVYWNRLKRGMKLQADPTVQYALGFPPRRLTYRDYRIEHPYNTYLIVGLPPGPIKAASVRAIEAVLDPEQHDYLYFCGSGDSTGTHRFARTYREHVENVRRYHAVLRQQGRWLSLTQR